MLIDYNTRLHLLKKIAASSGILTSFVEQNLDKGNFKKQFLKIPEGQNRDQMVYDAIIANGKPELVPVTVTGPNGVKLTYNVTPDYVKINGFRVTVPPSVAQRVANHFDMKLPTDKMSQQIYDAADTKVRAIPLSSQGYTGQDGQYYNGKEVANNRIGKSDAAIAYNQLTDEAIQKQVAKSGKSPKLIAGHGKDILQPTQHPDDVRIGGWHGATNAPLQPYSNTHKGEAKRHTEYAMYTRLIDNQNVTITMPDGRVIPTTLDAVQNDPNLSKLIAAGPGTKKYTI